MSTLDNLEERIRSLIEIHLVKLMPGYQPEDEISQKLASAMFAQTRTEGKNIDVAPNVYVIIAHPSNVEKWRREAGFLDGITQVIELVGKEENIKFASKVTTTLSPDPSMTLKDIKILGSFNLEGMAETQGIQLERCAENRDPSHSFLILNGSKIIPLDQPVINVGRRLDNHIVIDDPRVSRNHAQIRAIKDHFVIFDLNSSGGTYVNGDRINQSILFPGDVLSLAGVTLIFGQDQPISDQNEQSTQPNESSEHVNHSQKE